MFSTIKPLVILMTLMSAASLTLPAQQATPWMIDQAHTSVNFSINHFFSAVTGKFTDFEGNVSFDPDHLEASSAEFVVSINSVNTGEADRDAHLQSPDFFDAQNHPKLTFRSTKFVKQSDQDYLVHGNLTIRGTTKTVILPMKITGEMEHPMMEGTVILGVVIDTTLDRTDYGVGTGDWAATMVVGDEVRIHIPMELNRKKA